MIGVRFLRLRARLYSLGFSSSIQLCGGIYSLSRVVAIKEKKKKSDRGDFLPKKKKGKGKARGTYLIEPRLTAPSPTGKGCFSCRTAPSPGCEAILWMYVKGGGEIRCLITCAGSRVQRSEQHRTPRKLKVTRM